MIPNNNLSPIAFYRNINEQMNRRSYAYGNVYPIFVSANSLLPFQIIRSHTDSKDFNIRVMNPFTGRLVKVISLNIDVYPFPDYGYDILLYNGGNINLYIPESQCYLTFSDGVNVWYSDMIVPIKDLSPYLCLQWYDTSDFIFLAGAIVYKSGYKNTMYFITELGKPEYTFEDEGEERDGLFFPEKLLSYKTYKFNILADEATCDVLRIAQLSDIVMIKDKYGNTYRADTFQINPKWEDQGDLASVEASFTTSTVMKKCGYLGVSKHDYNNDFNEDFY